MEIKELQKYACEKIDEIDKKRKADTSPETIFLHLTEEIGEIARQLVNPKLGRDQTDNENIKEEIVDSILLLFKLAKIYNIDLEFSINKKLNKLKSRVE